MDPAISPRRMRHWRAGVLGLSLFAALVTGFVAWRIRGELREALENAPGRARPLQFVAIPTPSRPFVAWGGSAIVGVAWHQQELIAAGDSGVFDALGRRLATFPSLACSALGSWRGRPVVALASGGFYRLADGRIEAARSGFGTLHVRAFLETAAGELLIGAHEGLFRAAWGDPRLEQLDPHPVRALALRAGSVLAGGETGLRRIEASRVELIETPDPWIDALAVAGPDLYVVTATGLARATGAGPIETQAGGADVIGGVALGDRFVALVSGGDAIRRYDGGGRSSEEWLPSPARRLFALGPELLADTPEGLQRRRPGGWTRALATPPALPPGPAHVTALARQGERIVAGLFDGGLAVGTPDATGTSWHAVPGTSVWGVNALLPAGGALYVASLRGAARLEGERVTPLEGPGAAFSLAATPDGVAIGYGQGVLLPGPRLVSAWHGLPGNQATALLGGEALLVGTPSGLGSIESRRVAWRITSGDGQLPHPWVTALSRHGDAVYVGTYGGGVARREASGRYHRFPDTQGLKVSAGAIVEAGGALYVGTEGRGLFRLRRDGRGFEAVEVALPSPTVTALLAEADSLYVGTDQGIARLAPTELAR